VIPALRKLMKENQELKASLDYIVETLSQSQNKKCFGQIQNLTTSYYLHCSHVGLFYPHLFYIIQLPFTLFTSNLAILCYSLFFTHIARVIIYTVNQILLHPWSKPSSGPDMAVHTCNPRSSGERKRIESSKPA
jgi:hypothetical protein